MQVETVGSPAEGLTSAAKWQYLQSISYWPACTSWR